MYTHLIISEKPRKAEKLAEAKQKAYDSAGLILAGIKQLQQAHKEIEIYSGDADYCYYNLLDGQPGTKRLEHLKAKLTKFRSCIKSD